MKKGMEMVWSQILGGILMLLVLAVIIFLVIRLSRGPVEGIRDTGDGASDEGSGVLDDLMNNFGKCEPSAVRCNFGRVQTCIDGKWETEEKCENGCKDGVCQ